MHCSNKRCKFSNPVLLGSHTNVCSSLFTSNYRQAVANKTFFYSYKNVCSGLFTSNYRQAVANKTFSILTKMFVVVYSLAITAKR